MNSIRSPVAIVPAKTPAGIAGFDAITGGGLSSGCATLRPGGPGSGKTTATLQFMVHGAQDCKNPGISGASPASNHQPK